MPVYIGTFGYIALQVVLAVVIGRLQYGSVRRWFNS